MALTSKQVRAARGLVDVSQDDIHRATGLTQGRISLFEKGKVGLTSDNLLILQKYFENLGVEFTAYNGVRDRPEDQVILYKGASEFVDFLHDVYYTVKTGSKDVVVNNVSEDLFLHWEGDYAETHKSRMIEAGARFRIIVQEGDDNFIASDYAEYKWSPSFSTISYYVYGDRTGLINFQKNNVTVHVTRSEDIADYFRNEFQKVWDLSRVPHE